MNHKDVPHIDHIPDTAFIAEFYNDAIAFTDKARNWVGVVLLQDHDNFKTIKNTVLKEWSQGVPCLNGGHHDVPEYYRTGINAEVI